MEFVFVLENAKQIRRVIVYNENYDFFCICLFQFSVGTMFLSLAKAVYCWGGHADRHFIRYAGTQKTEFTFYEIVKFKNPSSMKMYGNVKFCVCHPRICICVTSPKFTALGYTPQLMIKWPISYKNSPTLMILVVGGHPKYTALKQCALS